VRIITSRDFFALSFALLAVVGLAWAIPWLMLAGTAGWWLIIAGAVPWVIRAAAARKAGAVAPSAAP
jgi:hypothetical protein